jgi:hypothetical protein
MSLHSNRKIVLSNGKIAKITPSNASELKIDTSNIAFIDLDVNDQHVIQRISLEGRYDICLGDKVSLKIGAVNSIYTIEHMEVDKKAIIIQSSIKTKVAMFLLPLLDLSKNALKFNSFFVNAYLNDNMDSLCLLYRFTGTELYKQFESNIMRHKLYTNHIEYDKYHVLYILRIPEEFKADIQYFIQGSYSKFSKGAKKLILKFYQFERDAYPVQIINQSEKLRSILEDRLGVDLHECTELASKPEKDKEIYNITINHDR